MKVRRKIGEKGQVTIPKDIRERLGMLPGTDVFFDVEDDEVIVESHGSSFVEWSKEVAEKAGPLEKSIDEYRKEQIEERVSA